MTTHHDLREEFEHALDAEREDADCIRLTVDAPRDEFSIEMATSRGPALNVAGPYYDESGSERIVEYAEAHDLDYTDGHGFVVLEDLDDDVDALLGHTRAILEASDADETDITDLTRRRLRSRFRVIRWLHDKVRKTA